jgi:glutathione S-transferase
MTTIRLVIANKNYSSWSLRAWLVLAQTGAPFQEVVVPLRTADSASAIREHSPSGMVPVLQIDGLTVWDSLAIAETLAERFPAAGLWPADRVARAVARSVAAEMHSGFRDLRQSMPMNVRASKPGIARTPAVETDIARIVRIWHDCRRRFGRDGPFLFGAFSAADAFYAPVVSRFTTYGVALDDIARAYAEAVMTWPAMIAWCEDARAEPWAIPAYDEI